MKVVAKVPPRAYVGWVQWIDDYRFGEDMWDLREDAKTAASLAKELRTELHPQHPLYGQPWNVVARARPQDDIVVWTERGAALVHLTWSGSTEAPPFPVTLQFATSGELDAELRNRY